MTEQLNYNPMSSADFKLVIPGLEEMNYFCQRAPLPGMHMEAIPGSYVNNYTKTPGETVQYDDLIVDIIVDEDAMNVIKLQQWMMSFKQKEKPYDRLKDISLHILTRNKTQNLLFVFYGCFPTDIEQLSFDSTLGDIETTIVTVTFSYQYFELVEN